MCAMQNNSQNQMPDEGQHLTLGRAFGCAWRGICRAVRTQRNMRIHLVIAVIAIVLGLLLSISPIEWCAIVLCIVIVFALEILNTALESIIDLVSPDYHELAGRAKDCSAGAVLVAAVGSVLVGAFIYIPHVVSLFTG